MAILKEKVQVWKDNGCDYDEGLQLLLRNSNHRSLIKHLGRGEATDDKREHLLYHLNELAKVEVIDPFAKQLPEDLKPREDDLNPKLQEGKNYPAEVVELKALKAKLYNDRAIAHKKFHKIGTDNDEKSIKKRKEVKAEIEEITKQFSEADAKIQEIFDDIKTKNLKDPEGDKEQKELDAPKTDGQVDCDKGLSAEDAMRLQKELTNNIAYISKNKDNKKPAAIENVKQRKARNKEIEKLLKGVK